MLHGELPHHHCGTSTEVFNKMPDDTFFNAVAAVMSQLGDKNRLKIFWILCHCEDCVLNISAMMEMSSPAVSHHLKILKSSGLISSRREGKEVYYKAVDSEQASMLHEAIETLMTIVCPVQKNGIINEHNHLKQ